MKTSSELWQKFRRTQGLIGGTIDLVFMALPNHPNPQNWKDHHIRGTIKKITWTRKKSANGRMSTITLEDLTEYLPGERAWQEIEECDHGCCFTYCGLGDGPYERDGKFRFDIALTSPAIVIPKGVHIPRRHTLYLTRKEKAERNKNAEALIEKLFPGK